MIGGEQEQPETPRRVVPTNPNPPEAATFRWPSATQSLTLLAKWQLNGFLDLTGLLNWGQQWSLKGPSSTNDPGLP